MYTSGLMVWVKPGRLIAALAVMALSCAAQSPSLTTLYSFGGGANGANPSAALAFGGGKYTAGLFGTTPYGGTAGTGTIFELAPGTSWTQTVIYNFQGGTDGANPAASLIASPDGILYGTTQNGGLTGNGTVFELRPPTTKGGSWTEIVLYNFAGTAAGTVNTNGTIVTQTEGSPFATGSAWVGLPITIGNPPNTTVYTIASVQSATQLTLTASAGTQTTNYSINDGGGPLGNVIRLSNNKLYGTTFGGGTNGAGTAFQLVPPVTSGPWTESVIFNFGGGKKAGQDGSGPQSGLLVTKGDLYGTTCCGTNGGTVFKLAPGKSGWTETVLHAFTSYSTGYAPYGGLVEDANGVIYGTTTEGGANGYGTIFSLTPEPKGAYKLTTIHSFTNGADGGSPYGDLLLGGGGALYATVTSGCAYSVGGVLEFTPPSGSGSWTETVLYNFMGAADGSQPFGGVIADISGNLYGTTAYDGGAGYGTAFELIP